MVGAMKLSEKVPNTRAVLVVVCLALATVVSAVSSLNVAIPDIARDTHASQTQLSWIIDAYALTFAALLLAGGGLGDRFGRRRVLLVGLLLYGFAALGAMFAHGADELIALRAVLGLAAALVMPATLATITATFPAKQRMQGVAVWTGVAGASAVLGLLLSGALLEIWSWRSVFGLNVVLAAIAVIGTLRAVPESAQPDAAVPDLRGTTLSVLGLAVLVYSVIEAPTQGWSSARTLIGILAGLILLAAFIGWEARQPKPLLDPRLFRIRGFAAGTLSIAAQFFAFFGFVFVFLQYLQLVRGDSALVAAISMLPLAAGLMPAARLAPSISARVGPARVCGFGLVLIAAALMLLAATDAGTSYWYLLAGLLALGVGMGSAMTPATAAITDALPDSQQGVASAVNDLSRELGGALGIAVLGSVLNATYRDHLELPGAPAATVHIAKQSIGAASQLAPPIAQRAAGAFVDGVHATLLTGGLVVAIAAVGVGLLLRGVSRGGDVDPEAPTSSRRPRDAERVTP